MRFAHPVLQERARIAEQALRARVRLSWQQLACGGELKDQPPPWDWFVSATC